MALFGKSRQVVRRAWRRFLSAFRWNLGAARLYHIPLGMEARVLRLSIDSRPQMFDLPMLEAEAVCRDATVDAEVVEIPTSFEPPVLSEAAPSELETSVTEVPMQLLATAVGEVSMLLPSPVVRIIERGLRMSTNLKGFEPRRWTAKTMGLRVSPPLAPVRDGLARVANLPVLRTSIAFLRLPPEARLGYWRELVSQVQRQPKELELLGIFPNVPTTGIEKATIDAAKGELKLWYGRRRTDAKAGTLLVARERESGRIHRVFDRRSVATPGR